MILASAAPARADLDHHCLSTCVSGGNSGPDCLKQCTYNSAPKPTVIAPITLDSLEAHKTFKELVPVGPYDIAPKPPQPKPAPDEDPICVSGCLKTGLQYDFCSEQCVKPTCPPGVILCKKSQNPFVTQTAH